MRDTFARRGSILTSAKWAMYVNETKTRDPRMRADRYQRLARQYFDLAKEASSPSLRPDYQRTAEEYRVRAQGELKLLEREGAFEHSDR
jgi:hypothetical protein